jgi:L-alanine-DL-glutamate epimerase-like enolase superfamily enzyme
MSYYASPGKSTDARIFGAELYFLPVQTRLPLKFGRETMSSVTCARVRIQVEGRQGARAEGWGETPLSVQWVWPSELSYGTRHEALKLFCEMLARAWANFADWGHPLELGHDFSAQMLHRLLDDFNASRLQGAEEPMPWLAALVCSSAFDLALHDAYGNLNGRAIYSTYTSEFLSRNLGDFLDPGPDSDLSFKNRFPDEFLLKSARTELPVWHLVGGLDPLAEADLTGAEPSDGYPVLLADWIRRDGLRCLKIKLRGTDAAWDYQRIVAVARLALPLGVQYLTTDFNCTVDQAEYVVDILDRLAREEPDIDRTLLYVEQPFAYELERQNLDVRSISRRKPLFLDESAHDWRCVQLGRSLGWNGVALKTCKTQSGAILAACWAQEHGMKLMVQDLTNPMLAIIPHCLLAANLDTLMGIESNASQFYPEASRPEAEVHPGLYRRQGGVLRLDSISGSGFGMKIASIKRELPAPTARFGG